MIAQENNYTDSSTADYASVRARIDNQNQGFDVTDDTVSLSSANEYNLNGNHNLSSVLSQIKDDGPAVSGAASNERDSRNRVVDLRSNKANQYAENQSAAGFTNESLQRAQAAAQQSAHNAVNSNAMSKKNTAWLPLFFVTVIVTVAAYYLYMLDLRTNQLEESLSLYQQKFEETAVTGNKELLPGLVNINNTRQPVNNDITQIKASPVASVVKETVVADQGQPVEVAVQTEDIDALKNEINALRAQLETANSKRNEVKTPVQQETVIAKKLTAKSIDRNKTPAKSVADNKVTVNKIVTTGNWIVNLASFTSKDRTQGKVKQLLSIGYTPLIEEAEVKGTRVYRLIVDGFEEKSQAQLFNQIVAEQFGMKGGWIRKN